MIRRPPRSTQCRSSAASDVYKRQGLGERSHLFHRDLDLESHILDIMNVIKWEELDDFVLVGHSWGGMVITGVADRVPEKIRRLVYLDAFVPENGKSEIDYLPEELVAAMQADAAAFDNGTRPIPCLLYTSPSPRDS